MRKIQKNLMVMIIIGIVASTFLSGIVSLLSFTSIGKERSNEVLVKELQITAGYIDNLCAGVENMVLSMGDRFEGEFPQYSDVLSPAGQEYLENAKAMAKSFIAYNDNLAAVYYRLNPEISDSKAGFFLSKTQEDAEITEREPTDLSLFAPDDVEHVGWFYVPKNAGKPIWVSQYMNLNNNILTISYVKPLYEKDGSFIGVVGIDIDMSRVYEKLSNVRIYETGFAALLSMDGELLYTSQDMNIPEEEKQKIIEQGNCTSQYMQQQRRMTLLSQRLKYGDILLISIANEDLYVNENRVVFSIILITLTVSLILIAALSGLLNGLFHRVQNDALTKTKNRSAYLDTTLTLDEQIHTRKASFSIIIFDVNGLKSVNDYSGHSSGDLLLSRSADEIRSYFPHEELYRIGGDEFVILSQHNKQDYLSYAFEKFTAEMERRKLSNPELVVLSSGMAQFDSQIDNCYDDVFKRADRLMYEDKADFYRRNPFITRR